MADDTIVAQATAPGEAAIAIVRLSGPGALEIAARHFRGKRSPQAAPSHRILFGHFHDDAGSAIDSVLLSVFRAPHSYTGEDMVEISSHGGAAVPAAILESLLRTGARPAGPGEFTERAFRNGKMDLAQAEAVATLVRARSDRAARAAGATMGGAVSRRIDNMDGELVSLLAEVEARIDFPSDVGERLDGPALARRAGAIGAAVDSWLTGLPSAKRRDAGLSVVLAGPPNVGKSSLMNALVGYDRAIVSETPGTTRDTVESSIWIDGLEMRLTDTAGLRPSDDPVERIGVARTAQALERTDLAVIVLDRSAPGTAMSTLGNEMGHAPVLVAWNKADLAGGSAGIRAFRPEHWSGTPLAAKRILAEVDTVAIEPGGAEPLRIALSDAIPLLLEDHGGDELPATSARQEPLLLEARAALLRAEKGLDADDSYDLIAVDLTDARRALGEVIGRGVDQSVTAAVFARFCIGK